MNINIYSKGLSPLPHQRSVNQSAKELTQFQKLLNEKIDGPTELKLSKHAKQRMTMRGIEFSQEKWIQIQDKVNEAKQKGVKDSLVITSNAALVVNTKNDTIITVLNREEAQSQIFTNINGTILID